MALRTRFNTPICIVDLSYYLHLIINSSVTNYIKEYSSELDIDLERLCDYDFVEDDEFLILNIEESKDGWARLVLEAHNGESFTASAPGTMGDKYEIMDNADKYIGQYVNVKFANLTKDGLPFHPIATAIRNKHKE